MPPPKPPVAELPEMVLLTILSVRLLTIPPPLTPVLWPEMVLLEIVSAPVLEMPPPLLGVLRWRSLGRRSWR